MKKLFATLTTIIILTITSHAQVVINEFMANSPGTGTDSLEFIELYNSGTSSVDISNWSFSQGVTLTFASGTSIPASGYLVVVYDSIAFMNYFGISGVEFSGGLSNNGEDITLINFKTFNEEAGNIYPSTSFCFYNPTYIYRKKYDFHKYKTTFDLFL